MSIIKGKGQRLIPEELLKYLEALKNKYPDAVDLVEANPTLEGGEDSLSSVLINGTKYVVGGGSEVHLYEHRVNIAGVDLVIYDTDNKDYSSKTNLINYLKGIGAIATSLTDYQHFHQATGFRKAGDDYNIVVGVVVYNNSFYVVYVPTFNIFEMANFDVYIPGALNQTTRQIF